MTKPYINTGDGRIPTAMLEFSPLTLSDINKLRPFILRENSNICDYTAGDIFMWRDYFSTEYAIFDDAVIFKLKVTYKDVSTMFSLPIGNNIHCCIEEVVRYCRSHDLPIAFNAVTDEGLEPLRSTFEKHEFYTSENWSDYIYRSVDLVKLEGRKYSNKRNHVNQFRRAYENYAYEEINNENLPQIRNFYDELCSETDFSAKIAMEEEDHNKTVEVLKNFDVYGLSGGLLRVGEAVVAFSIGEVKNDILFVHIEKADMRYKGVYQMINNEFAKHFATEGIEYINREEDVGDMGLRASKQSYHPYKLAKKYVFIVR